MGIYGELGDGTTSTSKTPVRVKGLSGASVAALTAGFGNTGALLSDGDYYDWGLNSQGQLGDGTIGRSSDVPVKVRLPRRVKRAASLSGRSPACQAARQSPSARNSMFSAPRFWRPKSSSGESSFWPLGS